MYAAKTSAYETWAKIIFYGRFFANYQKKD